MDQVGVGRRAKDIDVGTLVTVRPHATSRVTSPGFGVSNSGYAHGLAFDSGNTVGVSKVNLNFVIPVGQRILKGGQQGGVDAQDGDKNGAAQGQRG